MAIPDPVYDTSRSMVRAQRPARQVPDTVGRRPGETLSMRLKPNDLIAMLTQHYERVRARAKPKVATKLSCFMPNGKAAVRIRLG